MARISLAIAVILLISGGSVATAVASPRGQRAKNIARSSDRRSPPKKRDLSEQGKQIINWWSKEGYLSVNASLLARSPWPSNAPYSLREIVAAVRTAPRFTGWTRRTISLEGRELRNFRARVRSALSSRRAISLGRSFNSASADPDWFADSLLGNGGEDNLALLIKSRSGRLIAPYSFMPWEKEVLFLPNTKVIPTHYGIRDGVTHVTFEEAE